MGSRFVISLLLTAFAAGCGSAAESEDYPELVCETGPAVESFGEADWLVYGCDEPDFLVAVSAEGNPAAPSLIFLKQDGFDIQVSAEGSGDKAAVGPAVKQLQSLSRAEFKALVARTGDASH